MFSLTICLSWGCIPNLGSICWKITSYQLLRQNYKKWPLWGGVRVLGMKPKLVIVKFVWNEAVKCLLPSLTPVGWKIIGGVREQIDWNLLKCNVNNILSCYSHDAPAGTLIQGFLTFCKYYYIIINYHRWTQRNVIGVLKRTMLLLRDHHRFLKGLWNLGWEPLL